MKPNTLTTDGHYIKFFQRHTGLTEREDTSNKSENNTQITPNIITHESKGFNKESKPPFEILA